jgi:putative flippase GtrA
MYRINWSVFEDLTKFVKFGVVGISNALISFIVYCILIFMNTNYIIANTIGFIVSVFNAYYWNKKYVFKKDPPGAIIKVFIVYGLTFVLNTILLFFMVNNLDISSYIAPIIILCLITPINYLFNKLWALK